MPLESLSTSCLLPSCRYIQCTTGVSTKMATQCEYMYYKYTERMCHILRLSICTYLRKEKAWHVTDIKLDIVSVTLQC